MEKIIEVSMAVVIVITLAIGVQALTDINDGRIATVVSQLLTPNVQSANAENNK